MNSKENISTNAAHLYRGSLRKSFWNNLPDIWRQGNSVGPVAVSGRVQFVPNMFLAEYGQSIEMPTAHALLLSSFLPVSQAAEVVSGFPAVIAA